MTYLSWPCIGMHLGSVRYVVVVVVGVLVGGCRSNEVGERGAQKQVQLFFGRPGESEVKGLPEGGCMDWFCERLGVAVVVVYSVSVGGVALYRLERTVRWSVFGVVRFGTPNLKFWKKQLFYFFSL
ncbi:hypothetical protein RHMOL_Rhmol05G0238100 [Rhododendron molle]|uniref:Uncharacterized protein n=1 Tax=Rhododendron molle TaxID=49168 RepID=A0ACC0NTK2_RHOML|nr:hypothetical protein RHMOL_Rhmol05G0238100 [Rhododendron molle]